MQRSYRLIASIILLLLPTVLLHSQSHNIVRYDTICPGETGCHVFWDTLFFEDFESGNSSCWQLGNGNATKPFAINTKMCWWRDPSQCNNAFGNTGHSAFSPDYSDAYDDYDNTYASLYSMYYNTLLTNYGYYLDVEEFYQDRLYNGIILSDFIRDNFGYTPTSPAYMTISQWLMNNYMTTLISPKIDIIDPANTSVSFDYINDEGIKVVTDGYGGFDSLFIYDEVGLYYRNLSESIIEIIWDENCDGCSKTPAETWTHREIPMPATATADGNADLIFTHIAEGGVGMGIDNILVYGPRQICIPAEVSALPGDKTLITTDTVLRYGCQPSIITTIWYVRPNNDSTDLQTHCDTYTWPANGQTYTTDTTACKTAKDIHGCDSTLTLSLTLHHKSDTNILISSCLPYTWDADGLTHASSGTYSAHTNNQYGCDSALTLQLTIRERVVIDSLYTACDSFYWAVTDSTYYTDVIDSLSSIDLDGCDTTTRLLLTVRHATTFHDSLASCDSLLWHTDHDTMLHTAGLYHDTIANVAGCDSIMSLQFTVNERTYAAPDHATRCDSMTWDYNGQTYDSTGTYYDTLTNASGCDSIIMLQLTINRSHRAESWDTLCDSFFWASHNRTYTSSLDNATEVWKTDKGCDSIIVMHVTVHHTTRDTMLVNACDSFFWSFVSDTMLYTSGTYRDTLPLQNAKHCDSVQLLQLTVSHSITMPDQDLVGCDSLTWPFNNRTYYADTVTTDTIATYAGCDSIATMRLSIAHQAHSDTFQTVCDSFYWDDTHLTYRRSGTDTLHIPTATHCDSLSILHLTILPSTESVLRATACDTFIWHLEQDNLLTISGTFRNTIRNAAGCDSVRILQLTINNSSIGDTQSMVACSRYIWPVSGSIYQESGLYSATLRNAAGCDSTTYLDLIVSRNMTHFDHHPDACDKFYWETTDSTYTVTTNDTAFLHNQYGCDSIRILFLYVSHSTVARPLTVSACEQYVWHRGYDVTLRQSGTYIDTIANAAGCDSTITLHLTIHHHDTVHVYDTTCDDAPFQFFGQRYVETGNYFGQTTNQYDCDSLVYLHLKVFPTFSRYILDTAFREELPYVFLDQYEFDSEVLDYPVSFTTSNGCDSTYYLSLYITIRQLGCDQSLVFPNVVTPNGDGINDRFCVLGIDESCYPHNELFIYNRWGTLVFHRKNFSSCADAWEPDYMPAGTYYYRFQARNLFGSMERTGVVEVVKD